MEHRKKSHKHRGGDEEEERVTPKRRGPSKAWLIGLLAGGTTLLVVFVPLVLRLAVRDSRPAQEKLLGTWESTNSAVVRTLTITPGQMVEDLNRGKLVYKYRLLNETRMEIESLGKWEVDIVVTANKLFMTDEHGTSKIYRRIQ